MLTREDIIGQENFSETYLIGENGVNGLYFKFKKELSDIQFWGAEKEEPEHLDEEELVRILQKVTPIGRA